MTPYHRVRRQNFNWYVQMARHDRAPSMLLEHQTVLKAHPDGAGAAKNGMTRDQRE